MKSIERDKKIIQVFNYMIEHDLSLNKTAKQFSVDPGTLVKWKKRLEVLDQTLYNKVQMISDKNNSNKQVSDVKRRTYQLAKVIIKYKLTLSQAIIYCNYDLSPSKLSNQLKQYLDEEMYQAVKVVLDSYNGSRTTVEQQKYFLQLLQEKQVREKQRDERFESMPHVKQMRMIVNDLLNENESLEAVALKNDITVDELILHIHELLPEIDYVSYQKIVLKFSESIDQTLVERKK